MSQETIEPQLFNSMLETCKTKREQNSLYKMANSLPKDIYISSIQKNKNQVFYESGNKDYGGYEKFIKSLLGTFVVYTKKSDAYSYQGKISDSILLPPSNKTMSAILKYFRSNK